MRRIVDNAGEQIVVGGVVGGLQSNRDAIGAPLDGHRPATAEYARDDGRGLGNARRPLGQAPGNPPQFLQCLTRSPRCGHACLLTCRPGGAHIYICANTADIPISR
jgi:hypothetical protein